MNIPTLIIGTVLIVLISWSFSIKHKRFHGIPRFFAFESIYLLILLNFRVWFHDPFSLYQVISWVLLILSAYFGLTGYLLLKRKGRSSKNFENTTVLVKSGVYRLIRHPLYFSLFLLGTGVMMKDPQGLSLVLGFVNLVAVWFTALTEEKEMVKKFGEPYKEYMKETKMFIPYIL
jgi:protein-S-isoprenylcysteine O-methyltransferase Ste14